MKWLAAATTALLAASGLSVLVAPAASAQEITDAITDVRIAETEISSGKDAMRLDLDFTIGAGIDAPGGGTVQAGDTFWIKLDPRLYAQNGTFNVYAEEDPTVVVATVSITGGELATFTLTDYVEGRDSTTGSAFWSVSFSDASIPADDYDLVFLTSEFEFQDRVKVLQEWTPGTRLDPYKFGVWSDADQNTGGWIIHLPNGPADTMVVEDFGHTNGPAWEFDCAKTLANEHARYLVSPAHEVSFECAPDHVRWEIADVPEYTTGGNSNFPKLGISFKVTDPSTSGDLVFINEAQYSIDDGTPKKLKAEIRQTRGGQATGPTSPITPRVVQATCDNGTITAPTITPAQNGRGITYSLSDDDYAAGDSVDVIAKLSPGYSWNDPLPAGWSVNGDGDAILTVVLDEPVCVTAVTPVNPEVTQATCIAGSGNLTTPTVTVTDTPEIDYRVVGEVRAGESVQVIAELADTIAYEWDSGRLPSGWSINGDGDAVRTIVLDAPPCATAVTPVSPDVTQATCIAGTGNLTTPTVAVTDTDEIDYRIVGEVRAGESVQIVAHLKDAVKHEWADTLPSGWSVNGDGDAVQTVVLDAPPCARAILPITPDVTQATCIAGTGELTTPTVTPKSSADIEYRVVGTVKAGESVQVIAHLKDAGKHEWADTLPSGWIVNGDGDAVRTIVLEAPPCASAIVPVSPDVTQATCIAGTGNLTTPSVTAKSSADIDYRLVGTVKAGESVQVIAHLKDAVKHEWADTLPSGWSVNGDGDAVLTVVLTTKRCVVKPSDKNPPENSPKDTPPHDAPPSGTPDSDDSPNTDLASTGANGVLPLAGIALGAACLIGAAALFARRRRVR